MSRDDRRADPDARPHLPHPNQIRRLRDDTVRELDAYVGDYAWLYSMIHGGNRGGEPNVSGGGPSNPTKAASFSRGKIRSALEHIHRNLTWFYSKKLFEWQQTIESMNEELQWREADDRAGAHLTGGVSAYRGDQRAPAGRPDLQEQLDAQRRRLDRGQGYGEGG